LGEGDVILKTSSFLTHLEHELHSPVWRHWVRELSAHARYIRYDQRGNGLSDWDVENISFEACVSDLEAVIDTLGLERVTLLGVSQGASLSIEYARRHPDRVRRLLLVGGYAAGWRKIGIKLFEQRREALLNLIKAGWGMNNPAFRQPYSSLFFPNGSEDLYDWFNELQRISATPENAWRIMNMLGDIDVRDALSELDVPVLVIHSLNDQIVPFAAGKMLAAKIRNAQLLPLESDNHLVLETEPAWTTLIEEIKRFLCLTGTNTDAHA
jgi:pimeloyl-ACP methyl ester carboxylesterase